jgi:hypothetical protein
LIAGLFIQRTRHDMAIFVGGRGKERFDRVIPHTTYAVLDSISSFVCLLVLAYVCVAILEIDLMR